MSNIESPLISICIPAYKNIEHLERLLNSISKQIFKNFEVVITDDTPDDSVSQFVAQSNFEFALTYFKNYKSLGTPENWNEAVRKSSGEYIKLMHNDDWFASPDALSEFVYALEKKPKMQILLFSIYERY